MSKWDGSVAFDKLARAGIKFGYSKATQGLTIVDSTFQEHNSAGLAAGLSMGAYHFFDYRADGVPQADFFVDTVLAHGGFDDMLPPVIDVECFNSFGVSDPPYAAAQIKAFVGQVYVRTGRMPAIYTSNYMWKLVAGADRSFGEYPLWVACWNCFKPTLPAGWLTWTFWQDGPMRVKGIRGAFDGNVFNGTDDGVPLLRAATHRIGDGAAYLGTNPVTLDLNGRDGVAYRVTTDGAIWFDWAPYPPTGTATLDLGPDGPKTVMVQLQDPFGNLSPPSVESLTVDTTAPRVEGPTTSFKFGPQATTDGTTPVTLTWSATDDTSGLLSAELTGSCGTGPSTTQTMPAGTVPAQILEVQLKPGSRCDFSAEATDNAGHSSLGQPTSFALQQREQTTGAITWAGTWAKSTATAFSGGSARYATKKSARATLQFSGMDVAIVTTRGPSRGRFQVIVDGVVAGSVDLYSPKTANRQIVFIQHLADGGAHTITIRVLGSRNASSTGKRVDVDAFLVLTP